MDDLRFTGLVLDWSKSQGVSLDFVQILFEVEQLNS